jgi:hypothetical protein
MKASKEPTLDDIIGTAFMCGIEQALIAIPDEEMKHRIEAFEHSRGFREIKEHVERLIDHRVTSELCKAYTQVVGLTLVENPKMSKSKFVSRFTKYLNEYGAERRKRLTNIKPEDQT